MASDEMSVEVHRMWATTFYRFQYHRHAEIASSLTAYLYGLRDQQASTIASGVAPSAKSAAGLYEGDFGLLDHEYPAIAALRTYFMLCLRNAVSHVNGGQVSPNNIVVKIPDSWYQITNQGGFHDAHYHGNCSWCGIYYVQVGETGKQSGGAPNGASRFYSPIAAGGSFQDYGNNYLKAFYLDTPCRDGTLLLFPAYLLHSGLPYAGSSDRIVIAFNSCSTLLTEATAT